MCLFSLVLVVLLLLLPLLLLQLLIQQAGIDCRLRLLALGRIAVRKVFPHEGYLLELSSIKIHALRPLRYK